MQTDRDAKIVAWLAGIGAAGVEHVMARFGVSHKVAYRRLSALRAAGLLDFRMMLYHRPGMYSATREGLRWQAPSGLSVYRLRPGGFEHAWEVATAAVALHGVLPGWTQMAAREIKRREHDEGRLIASTRLDAGDRRRTLHAPDLALFAPSGRLVGIEVELTVKAPRELERICRAWARARSVDHVYYLARPDAARAVTRAIDKVRAEDAITVLALDDVEAVVSRELAKEARTSKPVEGLKERERLSPAGAPTPESPWSA